MQARKIEKAAVHDRETARLGSQDLSNRVFKSYDNIVDHCCYAWNTLLDQPWKIISIARRDWVRAPVHPDQPFRLIASSRSD